MDGRGACWTGRSLHDVAQRQGAGRAGRQAASRMPIGRVSSRGDGGAFSVKDGQAAIRQKRPSQRSLLTSSPPTASRLALAALVPTRLCTGQHPRTDPSCVPDSSVDRHEAPPQRLSPALTKARVAKRATCRTDASRRQPTATSHNDAPRSHVDSIGCRTQVWHLARPQWQWSPLCTGIRLDSRATVGAI